MNESAALKYWTTQFNGPPEREPTLAEWQDFQPVREALEAYSARQQGDVRFFGLR